MVAPAAPNLESGSALTNSYDPLCFLVDFLDS
jgi:hypothetical protein